MNFFGLGVDNQEFILLRHRIRSIIVVFIGVNMTEKDINTLIRLSRKLGRSICDVGTFEERQTKHLIIKWKYKGSTFTHKFPSSPKSTSLNYQYSQLRKNLRASGLGPPDQGTKRPIGSDEQEELLRELWVYLGTDDEGETPYGGDVVK